ncbi:MAG: hypothetical protein ACLSH3_15765 [Alistipes finegoldii]
MTRSLRQLCATNGSNATASRAKSGGPEHLRPGTCREKGLEKIARFVFDHYLAAVLRVVMNNHARQPDRESVQAFPAAASSRRAEQDDFAQCAGLLQQASMAVAALGNKARALQPRHPLRPEREIPAQRQGRPSTGFLAVLPAK